MTDADETSHGDADGGLRVRLQDSRRRKGGVAPVVGGILADVHWAKRRAELNPMG